MGSENGGPDEHPHRVELDGFWIGKTEVTVGQWRSVMGSVPEPHNDQGDDHPVLDVSWENAQAFATKAGLELPTEAQWEYAARGTTGNEYPWGDWDESLCQAQGHLHGHARTAPVGSFSGGASWCGALDMAGNASEWCRDWYDVAFYATPAATSRNPLNTNDQSGQRSWRGGSWDIDPVNNRSWYRSRRFPDHQDHNCGLRVSQSD